MTAERYVNSIVRKIRCGGKRKREIRKQLLADIHMQIEQGDLLEEVIRQMGPVKEIAESFNENMSKAENRRYLAGKCIKFLLPIVLVLCALIGGGYWLIPRAADIGQSNCFEQEAVERKMQETITLFNAGDYEALRTEAIPQMQLHLNEEEMGKAKEQTAADWGEFQRFGTVYMQEVIQGNNHYVVGEITATYENVSVIFRLMYDENMKLAGLYMR